MHNFDRGLIKWLPFDALSGYKDAINALKQKRSKIEKPLLSDDQIQDLNYELTTAIKLRKSIVLYYYLEGKVYYQVGYVSDLDWINKKIKIGPRWLNATNILKIEIN